MGIYANNIEKLFRDLPELENVLQKYDNVTYHIQFFMVPAKILNTYSEIRADIESKKVPNETRVHSLLALDKNLYNHSVVIAESGITNTLNIDSMSMVTYPPAGTPTFGATTVEIELNLSEFNSSSLVNKIALASYLCGYESYAYQQYFVSVWFTGYDQKTGKPINKIPLDEEGKITRCTYQVTMGDVKTSSEGNKTTYKIKLYPSFYNSLAKDINIISDIGEVKLDTRVSYGEFIASLEEKINEKLKNQYGDTIIKEVYKGQRPLEIIVDDIQLKAKKTPSQEVYDEEVQAHYELMDSDNATWYEKTGVWLSANTYLGWKGNIRALTAKAKYTPEKGETIVQTIHKLSGYYNIQAEGKILQVQHSNVYLGGYQGTNYYRHKVIIRQVVTPGIKEMQMVIGQEHPMITETPSAYQLNYLNEVTNNGLLKKKYYWLYNGHNTDVLSIKTEDNNMWYLNLGLTDLYAINKNLPKFQFEKKSSGTSNKPTFSLTDNYSQYFNSESSLQGTFYIDDIYYKYIQQKDYSAIDTSTWHKIALSNSPLCDVPESAAVVNEDKKPSASEDEYAQIESSIRYKLGMENIFQMTGHKIKMELDILGDPYWMFYGDSTDNSSTHYLVLPHFLLFQRSFHEVDSFDEYQEDKLMEYNSIYTVTKIVSTLENGSFKQRLTGFVATPFLQSSKFENGLGGKESSTNATTMRGQDVVTAKNGSVTNVSSKN